MRRFGVIACVLIASAVPAGAQPPAASPSPTARTASLSGLWQARRRFGPDAVGRLHHHPRRRRLYRADIAGRTVPVRIERGLLSFELARRSRRLSRAHRRAVSFAAAGSALAMPANCSRYASPVTLRAEEPGRWSGEVATLQDNFTFYLLLRPAADGSLEAVLRNPERDVGSQWGVHRLVREGDELRLDGPARRRARAGDRQRPSTMLGRGRLHARLSRAGAAAIDFARDGDHSDFYPRGRAPGRYAYAPPPALE